MRIYYAHGKNLYTTPQERRDIDTLKKMGFEVLNPNSDETEKEYEAWRHGKTEEREMDYFHWKVDACDAVAFRSIIDGKITSGVWSEVQYALSKDKPVIELPHILKSRELSLEETREYLKLVGER